ncbi:unnamed protein product [Calypogeia fissa]
MSHLGRQNHGHQGEEKHKKHAHLGEAVALRSPTFAAYEHHKVKVDTQHAARLRREEHIAEAVALGAGRYTLHEHREVRQDYPQQQTQPAQGHQDEKKHHHGLFH